MKAKLIVWIVFLIFSNIILFFTCALPWYGVMNITAWYLFLAVPGTFLGGIIVSELLSTVDYLVDEVEYYLNNKEDNL